MKTWKNICPLTIYRLLVAVAVILCSQSGATADSLDEPLRLVPREDPAPIVDQIDIFVGGDDATFAEVIQTTAKFRRNNEPLVNPGSAAGTVWLRLDVENVSDEPGQWVLSFNRVLASNVGLFLVVDGKAEILIDGSSKSIEAAYKMYRTLAGTIALPPHTHGRIYLRYDGANWSGLFPELTTEQTFRQSMARNLAVFLFLLGGIGTLLVVGSVSFVFLGRQIVLFYALAQSAFFAFYAHFSGYTTIYLWPQSAQSFRIFAPLTMAVFIIAMAQFARRFFETRRLLPWVDKLLLVCLVLGTISVVFLPMDYLIPGFDRSIPLYSIYLVSAICGAVLPALAIYATWKWHRDFWPMIIAWGSTGFFILSMQLIWVGALARVPFKQNSYGFVVYTEALFMALAIALRIRVMRAEALDAERRSSESLRLQLAETQRARKLSEEREWALQDLAEKGRLLLTTGHDTRQMISALRNYSAGLRSVSQDEKVRQAGHRIDEIADHLNEVLTTAVEGSRSGGMTDNTLALDTLMPSKILDPLHLIHAGAAREKNIEIKTFAPDHPVVTDRVLVGRILGNFLSNAIKSTRSGKVLLAFRPAKDGCRFQVWDTGKGIEASALETLLASETGSLQLESGREGTGTGLSIAKVLATRLGGCIRARSEPGHGSVFELVLPHRAPLAGSGDDPNGMPRIVLADSDRNEGEMLRKTLIGGGHTVSLCQTMQELEDQLRQAPGDHLILVLDQHFGGSNKGLEWARDVSSRVPDCRIILMSFDRSVEARTQLTGASSILVYKPVSADAIKDATTIIAMSFTSS